MDRKMKTVISIVGAAAVFVLLSVAAYYLGGTIIQGTFSAKSGITYAQWEEHYLWLVAKMGGVGFLMFMVWYLLARFGLKISTPPKMGKRLLWIIIGGIDAGLCLMLPYLFRMFDSVLSRIFSPLLPVIYLVLYVVIGYWVLSIFFTPAPYKYVPFLAVKRGGKK